MPRVYFKANHVAVPHPSQSVKYLAGGTYLVSQAVAADVVCRGRGAIVPSPGETRPARPLAARAPRAVPAYDMPIDNGPEPERLRRFR